ncbi:hypothetical protein OW763_06955 [Clostridium aestuarii]|uniref:Exosortase n=1 Tax=Clostridium aestuarii TaxID=338193 RepID=A0ABT4D1Q9_9CLOT|nr:hypothetical protein [Clostridium aestuarii]MCY6484090.1 hypothetical protein [Clostridium aestuarii]
MKTLIFSLITLVGILLIYIGCKKNNNISKVIGVIFLIPMILVVIGSFV